MIDRDKVTSVLTKRFPSAGPADIAAAANAIVGLAHEYTPVAPASVTRFNCAGPKSSYTERDLLSGQLRVFVRTNGHEPELKKPLARPAIAGRGR